MMLFHVVQVLDLDGSAPNHLLSGRSGVSTVTTSSSDGIISGQRVQATTSTLLGNAEEVLVSAWQAFGAANPALLDLVEMQNPPRVLEGMGGGSVRGSLVEGVSTEGRERGCGGIGSLQRLDPFLGVRLLSLSNRLSACNYRSVMNRITSWWSHDLTLALHPRLASSPRS